MKRSVFGLVVALSLTACKEEPRGQMEPIPRPPGMKDAPPPAEAPAAAAAAEPPVDPSKVVLRWKLAKGASTAYRLDLERTSAAPASSAEPETPAKGAKGKGKAAAKPAPAAPPVAPLPDAVTYALELTDSGDYRLRVTPVGSDANVDVGTLSERGFVLDGLQGATRNIATLVLELPRDPVGPNDTWSLGTQLILTDELGTQFQPGQPERRNRVKLVSLTPVEGGEQVATLEYDISETLAGKVRAKDAPPTSPARAAEEDAEAASENPKSKPPSDADASAEVTITGRGEFLVKAGQWRSWEGTLTTVTKGRFPTAALQVPTGGLKLRLSSAKAAPTPTAQPEQ
ncbi:hypothetical protein A176_005444 [Myxococcus hansupus]|uniref:Lipoprotein n=1 Tax=Pseudomyxococcus hansupus TaxID=1297742 RepID=A0A0H4XJY4_9BACT|nr:hypothetical protein [Myxococcus hansupus]AKQ68532.1 hypothetical protein A176_005444 [Myxococcus hansupus]